MAWLPTAVPQDASRADFMCKRWRWVLAWFFFCGRFERLSIEIHVIWWNEKSQLLLRVFLKKQSPPVAENFILCQEFLFIEREITRWRKGMNQKEPSTVPFERDLDRRWNTPTRQHNQFSLLSGEEGGGEQGSRKRSVDNMGRSRGERSKNSCSIPDKGKPFSSILHSGSGVHPAPYSMWALSFFPGDGVAGSETDHLHLVSELKSACACVYSHP